MRLKLTAILVGWLVLSVVAVAGETAPEFRGVWVTRFEWATPDPDECKARITQVFETLAAKNFNAAVFQIRGEPDTLYPSQLEPWSDLIGGKDPGFDPAAFAIEQAHKNGIAFHAYINAMPLRSLSWREKPKDPNHLFNLHGPGSAEPWICVNQEGRPAKEDYYYLSAGVPQVQEYLVSLDYRGYFFLKGGLTPLAELSQLRSLIPARYLNYVFLPAERPQP